MINAIVRYRAYNIDPATLAQNTGYGKFEFFLIINSSSFNKYLWWMLHIQDKQKVLQ